MTVYGYIRKRHLPKCRGDALEMFESMDKLASQRESQGYIVSMKVTDRSFLVSSEKVLQDTPVAA